MKSSEVAAREPWQFFHFGLIVTGKGEQEFLPKLFRSIAATGRCSFKVIRRIDQRSPISSKKRVVRMMGSGKRIPNKDETDIGLPARRFLSSESNFVILVDDLESERAADIQRIFDRYRLSFDTILGANQNRRASVHFFVNMLEAYYLAHAQAVNHVLGTELGDYDGDVETIRHPKNKLKNLYSGFDQIEHGHQIVGILNAHHILSHAERCSYLRTMFAWIYKAIGEPKSEIYQLLDGRYGSVTKHQICDLEPRV